VPVAPLVTVGSAPGPDNLTTDAPEIVGIDGLDDATAEASTQPARVSGIHRQEFPEPTAASAASGAVTAEAADLLGLVEGELAGEGMTHMRSVQQSPMPRSALFRGST